ncbi:MAG: hypothetical protein AAGB12_01675 [Pseudomonadota bacterium]
MPAAFFLIFLLLLTQSPSTEAIEYDYHFKPLESFLPTQKISRFGSFVFDDRNYLCLSAKNQGLHCFDGIHMNEVSGKEFAGLLKVGGQVVGATRKQLFHLVNGNIELFDASLQPQLKENEKISQLYHKDNHAFFLLTNYGIHIAENTGTKVIYTTETESFSYVAPYDDRHILLGNFNGLFTLNVLTQEKQLVFKKAKVYEVTEQYYLTSKGVYDKSTHELLWEGEFFRSLPVDDDTLLVAGSKGICSIKLQRIACDKLFSDSQLSDVTGFSLIKDEYNNIYASTSSGLFVSSPRIHQQLTKEHGLSSNRVTSLELLYGNSLFIGTSNGLNRLDLQTQKISTIDDTRGFRIHSLKIIDNHLWIGVTNQGVYRMDLDSFDIQKYIDIPQGHILSIMEYEDAVFFGVKDIGLFKYSKAGELLLSRKQVHFKNIEKIQACFNNLYVGTSRDGLIRINSEAVIENYSSKTNLHTFDCWKDSIVAGSLLGEIKTLGKDLGLIEQYKKDSAIYSILNYDNSYLTINEQGIYFADIDRLVDLDHEYFLNVIARYKNHLMVGSEKGLYIIDLMKAKNQSQNIPALALSITDKGDKGAQILKVRSDNLMAVRDYDFFMSENNEHFYHITQMTDIFVFPEHPPANLYFYMSDKKGNRSPVKTLSLPSKSNNNYLWLTIICVVSLLLLSLLLFNYRKSIKFNDSITTKRLNKAMIEVDPLPQPLNEVTQCTLTKAMINQVATKLNRTENKNTHEYRLACLNELLNQKQKYLPGKEIAKEIGIDETKLRYSIRTIFGAGSVKDYTNLYLQLREENGCEFT